MGKLSSRDRILDAYQDILLEHGPAAVTLEAVATRAGVSKGGLLYHFGSKDALVDGLTERLLRLTDDDIVTANTAPDGPVRYYLRSSVSDAALDSPWHRATLAAIRLAPDEQRVVDALSQSQQVWRDHLAAHVDDPLTAELVALVGDGLYLRAALGGDRGVLLDQLDSIVHRLHHTG